MPFIKKNKYSMLSFIAFCTLFSLTALLISRSFYPLATNKSQNMAATKDYPTVIIDAGHGGEDGGAIGINGAIEKELNLYIAQKLHESLSRSGIDCVMTRCDDRLLYDRNTDYEGRKKALDMQARLKTAEQYPNSIFVSIHQNTFPQEKYSGLQVYYSTTSPLSAKLADSIQSTVKNNLQPSNSRATKADNGSIYLLRKLSCPAVLVECGFISNRQECEQLCTEEYRTRLATTLSDSIIAFFNEISNN